MWLSDTYREISDVLPDPGGLLIKVIGTFLLLARMRYSRGRGNMPATWGLDIFTIEESCLLLPLTSCLPHPSYFIVSKLHIRIQYSVLCHSGLAGIFL